MPISWCANIRVLGRLTCELNPTLADMAAVREMHAPIWAQKHKLGEYFEQRVLWQVGPPRVAVMPLSDCLNPALPTCSSLSGSHSAALPAWKKIKRADCPQRLVSSGCSSCPLSSLAPFGPLDLGLSPCPLHSQPRALAPLQSLCLGLRPLCTPGLFVGLRPLWSCLKG